MDVSTTRGTVVQSVIARLHAAGVRRMFGVPGGDCNLDFISAGEAAGIQFVLTRTETAAAIMASVSAELTGVPGVVMTTRGPGLANGANGIAYAQLDRAPLLVIADGYEAQQDYVSHQRLDQMAMMRPLVKATCGLNGDDPAGTVDVLLAEACAQPPGPVYLEVTGAAIRRMDPDAQPGAAVCERGAPESQDWDAARAMLWQARRPIVLAGLQACARPASRMLREFVARSHCPVLTTYKAKGVVPEKQPEALGHYIGGVAEAPAIRAADLILLYGFDPVEGPPQPWRFDAPVLELTEHTFDRPLLTPQVSLVGDIATALREIGPAFCRSAWSESELANQKRSIHAAAASGRSGGVTPQHVVETVRAAAAPETRITIDAGAHMLPVLHLWDCAEPRQALISRGLATMGFALPAAIGSCLTEPDRPVIAFTGDGGLMMCLGELGTAIQAGCKPIVVVFNDSSLALIGDKQRRRQFARAGVDFSPTDFARVARGFGWTGYRVANNEQLAGAVSQAVAADGPALIDVEVDAETYHGQIMALRG